MMKWKDSGTAIDMKDRTARTPGENSGYATLEGPSASRRFAGMAGWGFGGLILIGFIVFLLGRHPAPDTDSPRPALSDTRLEQLESRLSLLEGLNADSTVSNGRAAGSPAIADRLDRLEAAWNQRLEKIEKEIARLKKLPAPSPAPAAVPAAAPAARPAASPTPREPAVYEVRAGDTVYGISRKHGISVEALRRLNGLNEQDVIRPGQKLVVRDR